VNEVDLLVLAPKGFFLIEIKSHPGTVEGDAGTWDWHHEGRVRAVDNPLLLANKKAKKLATLLRRQSALQKDRSPYLDALVFLSHEKAVCRLPDYVSARVHLRDRPGRDGKPGHPGILAALTGTGPEQSPRPRIDRRMAKAISRAMDQAGIRPSQRMRQVGDWRLEELLLEGPAYQDWSARHAALDGEQARIRIYGVPPGAPASERKTIERAAQREYQILRGITHDGILQAKGYTQHALGPALVFEYRPGSQRLDHFLRETGARLSVDQRLGLLRQIAETLQYAHEKRLVHRSLAPQSILVIDPDTLFPRIQIYNWQTAARVSGGGLTTSAGISATSHLEDIVEEAAWVYLAPESLTERSGAGEPRDVFSLGALAYHLFSGQPPATNLAELHEKLREGKGLQISAVLDGAGAKLQELIQFATHPEVTNRLDTVADFLTLLDDFEEELTTPTEPGAPEDPAAARPGDRLDSGIQVKKRLGKGSTAVAFLVERSGREQVLKVALSPEQNERLEAEADALRRLRHQFIVELHDVVRIGDRVGLLLAKAGDQTLAQRLREEGRLQLELLERFGEDLLTAVDWLEQQGVPHRDLKPENLGVAELGRDGQLHLVLFDFSLARTPAENLHAGTRHYLDPFLSLRKPPRWDTHAERFAAAVTLYQMATGTLPQWGDGQSEPVVLDCEATIDADSFEPALREEMTRFFEKALRRHYQQRFDNAQEMLRAWRQLFLAAARPETATDHSDATAAVTSLEAATPQTPLAALGLSARALSAMERVGVRSAEELVRFPLIQVNRMRGVGSRTRRELTDVGKRLAARFPELARAPRAVPEASPPGPAPEPGDVRASVDELVRALLPAARGDAGRSDARILAAYLGLGDAEEPESAAPAPSDTDSDHAAAPWPSQSDVARRLGLTPGPVSQALARARRRWAKLPAITQLRHDLTAMLDAHAGVASARELAEALLARRGSVESEPRRSQLAAAALRAAVETERDMASSRWIVRRPHAGAAVLLARDDVDDQGAPRIDGQRLADWAERLGRRADALAATDPLPSPARVLEALQAEALPPGAEAPPPSRLLQLAAAASERAALSSRLELYPRGMEARRALRLALGALAGARQLGVAEIRTRVAGRYPEAELLPERPALDALLADAGSELIWDPRENKYRAPWREFTTVVSGTTGPRTAGGTPALEPDELTAREFDARLQRTREDGAFLALLASPSWLLDTERALAARFGLDVRSFDELLIRHMKEACLASKPPIDWQVVLRADAGPQQGGDWTRLQQLVHFRALPRVRAELDEAARPVLLTRLGLLARYDQMAFLDALRDASGRPGAPPAVWLLLPGDLQSSGPMIDGKPVPVFTSAQWARVPEAWLAAHRVAAPRPRAAAPGSPPGSAP